MISRSAEYALRAMVVLAREPGASMTTHQIADATHVPAGYLAKILRELVRARVITSQRGVSGGFALAAAPETFTLMHIVQVVDTSRRIGVCPLGISSHADHFCPLHRTLDKATAGAEEVLSKVTIADLLHDPSVSLPIRESGTKDGDAG